MAKLGDNQKSALNITACIVLVAINTCINFFLSPFIVKHLGAEANGYITLANNFIHNLNNTDMIETWHFETAFPYLLHTS